MEKIKVNIITGFLGAGKTTTILNLLKKKDKNENWAVIVNEFGEISIDTLTLSESTDSGRVYDIYGGCICCSAKEYFHENLNKIIQEKKFDRIVIEPTGLGGPDMVAEIILSVPELELMPSICLVDPGYFENMRIQMIPLFRIQIQRADVVVLSKCDLVADQQKLKSIMKNIQQIFPGKLSYSFSVNGDLDIGLLDSGKPIQKRDVLGINLSTKEVKSKTYTIPNSEIVDIEGLLDYFKNEESIIRAKGYVKGASGWRLINYTLTGQKIEVSSDLHQGVITIFTEFKDGDSFNRIDQSIQDCKV
ncbi:hypothetical protein E9993_18435 [Labilibacter sediminis]|nr:hypothetical protein E9993_18435 [Labilibacter sediminis]